MELKNRDIIAAGFITSFKRLNELTGIPAKDKLLIVGLRKQLAEAVSELQEVARASDTSDLDELLEQTREFKGDKIELTDAIVNALSAEDIFNLQPIIKGE